MDKATIGDIAIVTALSLHNVHPIGTEILPDRNKRVYHFDRTPYFEQIVEQYERGQLQVSAKMFALVYRDFVGRLRLAQAQERGSK